MLASSGEHGEKWRKGVHPGNFYLLRENFLSQLHEKKRDGILYYNLFNRVSTRWWAKRAGERKRAGRPGGGRRRRTGNRREEREERKTEVERATPVHTALSDFSGVETEAKEGSWVTLWEQQSDLKLLHVTRDTLPR